MDLTQSALADCAGCSLVTIRKFESDERRPSRQLAELLADCLKIPTDERETFVAFARQSDTAQVLSPRPGSLPAAALPQGTRPPALPSPVVASPPVAAHPQPLISLPAPLTGLIGRESDVDAVISLACRPGVRVVTLTGPGGTGKTRLAIESGRRLADMIPAIFPDGVVFVDLAPIEDPGLVIPIIAATLGVQDSPHRTILQAVTDYLHRRHLLLILDNFEQILDAADDLFPLLQGAAGLSLLVTSRSLLRLYGEYEYPVSPLPLPKSGATVSEIGLSPAVALFIERASAARPAFALTMENAAAVAAICARLDGLPLAIELAAARTKLMTPPALLSQLISSLDLAAQLRHLSERQRTLRGAIDWSYRLLTDEEQRLFAWLSIFSGGFSVSAAAAVLDGDTAAVDPQSDSAAAYPELIDRLASLVDKSMIQPAGDGGTGEARFRLLVVMREYALEQLDRRGERGQAARRHLLYFLGLAEGIAPLLEQKEQAEWLRQLAADYDNIRVALAFGLEQPEQCVEALRLAAALRSFWRFRGLFTEGRQWMSQLLAAAPDDTPPDALANAYSTAGMLARYQDDHDEAITLLHKSLNYFQNLGQAADRRQMAVTLRNIAAIYYWREELELVEQYTREILAIERELNNQPAVATMLGNLASVNKLLGRFELTRAYQTEALALHRQVSGAGSIVSSLNGLGLLEFHEGNLAESQRIFEEALALAKAIEDPYHQSMLLANLAEGKMVLGRLLEARADLDESLDLARSGGYTRLEMTTVFNLALLRLLEGGSPAEVWPAFREVLGYWRDSKIRVMVDVTLYPIAFLLSRAGQAGAAIRLINYVDSRSRNPVRAPDFQMMLNEIEPAARERLSNTGYRDAEAGGRAMNTEDAIALALRTGDALADQVVPDYVTPENVPDPRDDIDPASDLTGERLLAVGGMGEVYLARDSEGMPFVIKRLRPDLVAGRPDLVERFVREGKLLNRLNHPNIIRILGANEEPDGRYAIIMEYAPGGTLRDLLNRDGRLGVSRSVAIALELADALARAHHLGIIHRDLKPENVLLAADGTPLLTDFGLSYYHGEVARLTQPGMLLGTVAYMSPEALEGAEPDAATDIWALGVMLVEMITGRHPFIRDNLAATVNSIMADQVGRPPDGNEIPPPLAALIDKMLARNPKERTGSARQIAAELERIRIL